MILLFTGFVTGPFADGYIKYLYYIKKTEIFLLQVLIFFLLHGLLFFLKMEYDMRGNL